MQLKKMIMRGVVLTALIAGSGLTAIKAYNHNPPSPEDIAFARRTSDLLHNEVFAALLQEFSETTPENIEEGKQAISLIFNNANRDIRLVGLYSPLLGGFNNLPSDSFERRSMALALQGQDNISAAEYGGPKNQDKKTEKFSYSLVS